MTTEQLERRVADLERTVAALQRQVADLAAEDKPLIEVTPELKAEIERRIADAEANPQDNMDGISNRGASRGMIQEPLTR